RPHAVQQANTAPVEALEWGRPRQARREVTVLIVDQAIAVEELHEAIPRSDGSAAISGRVADVVPVVHDSAEVGPPVRRARVARIRIELTAVRVENIVPIPNEPPHEVVAVVPSRVRDVAIEIHSVLVAYEPEVVIPVLGTEGTVKAAGVRDFQIGRAHV